MRSVLLQADRLVTGLGRLEAEEIRQLRAVGGVLMDAELQVLPKLLVEFLVIVSLLRDLREHLEALLHEVLLDHAEDLVLLQRLTRDVERQVLRVHNALDEAEPLRDQLLAVVHDEDAAHVKLDVVALLLRLEEVERRATRSEEEGLELELTLNREMLHGEVVLPVVRQRLVEGGVLLR